MPDSYRRYKHHWTPNSRMPQVYEHLSKSIIHKIQSETWSRVAGVSKETIEDEKPIMVLKRCRRCEYENPRDSSYCNRCAFPLKESEAVEKAILHSNLEIIADKIKDKQQKPVALFSVAG